MGYNGWALVEVQFSKNEMAWLDAECLKDNETLEGFIRKRALNFQGMIPNEESFRRFCDMRSDEVTEGGGL
jgi:hypothetical protein